MATSDVGASDEFFDCLSEVRYCAIASPRGRGSGEVFVDFKKAQNKWKEVKGSRMKFFDSFDMAKIFADTPVNDGVYAHLYAPSPKADTESTSFPNVPQSSLLKFRTHIEKGNLEEIRKAVDLNPMHLVTSSDTPTLLQMRLRYNALHIAAAAGTAETLGVILGYLNFLSFWKRIYPDSDDRIAQQRQWHVIDLYLNSPELGYLETPLHFASKFGHLACIRLLATHPLTQLTSLNRANQTALDVAASRVAIKSKQNVVTESDQRDPILLNSVRRALDENFVILANVIRSKLSDDQVCILPPVTLQQLQTLLARTVQNQPSGLKTLLPFLDIEVYRLQSLLESGNSISEMDVDLSNYGSFGHLRSIRAFAGPMLSSEARTLYTVWTRSNTNSSCREFSSIRLTDSVKGYERQGRSFAKLFATEWFEYWDFLNDFLDLSSESGLEVFDQFLRRNSFGFEWGHTGTKADEQCITKVTPIPDLKDLFDGDEAFPSTPILRRRNLSFETPNSNGGKDIWLCYRDQSVVDDSVCDSNGSTDKHASIGGSASTSSSFTEPESSSILSPLIGLLSKLTFSSPLRWILMDGQTMGEPLFCHESPIPPHKRPVKVRTTTGAISLSLSPGKRKHSKVESNLTAPAPSDQPSPKKAASGNLCTNPPPHVHIPPLVRHICHALPGGDPEMDTAVAILQRSMDKTLHTQTRSDNSWPRSHLSKSLIKFPNVGAWKRHVESVLHFSRN